LDASEFLRSLRVTEVCSYSIHINSAHLCHGNLLKGICPRILRTSSTHSATTLATMVGVAGKSQACHDCKRRRVKCDLRRPNCSRCIKANIDCTGYKKKLVFLNQKFDTRTGLLCTSPPIAPIADNLGKIRWLVGKLKDGSYKPETLRKIGWGVLKDLYLPRTPHFDFNSPIYSWVFAVCQLKNPLNALDQASVAFCAIQFFLSPIGKATPNDLSVSEPLSLYNTALSSVRELVGDTTSILEDEAFGAIVMLLTCEVCVHHNSRSSFPLLGLILPLHYLLCVFSFSSAQMTIHGRFMPVGRLKY
jgi:hypothetical protein